VENRPLIAITMGDPSGIGPEIIVKGLTTSPDFCRTVVIGDAAWLQQHASQWAPQLSIHPIKDLDDARNEPGVLDVMDLHNIPENLYMGRATPEGGKAAVEYIRKAVELATSHQVHAITTAPINKEAMHLAGFKYPGHTEMLADFTHTPEVALMLAGGSLRVVLTTTHVPLSEVRDLLTRDRILKTIRLTHQWLTQVGIEQPSIAVTGLNPHSGDGGIFGNEEIETILPAIEAAQKENIKVDGPFSADALFGRIHEASYDAVITMYHDQGMIPIKMASMDRAVNITLGLPIIRTSVDHGTAFDIAGCGIAKPDSLLEALKVAATLAQSSLVSQ
jgi:4-phospho-D-threonate 3-dehydrogenase / 4-phospho-D-erythronate 3-dehydrogenase